MTPLRLVKIVNFGAADSQFHDSSLIGVSHGLITVVSAEPAGATSAQARAAELSPNDLSEHKELPAAREIVYIQLAPASLAMQWLVMLSSDSHLRKRTADRGHLLRFT